MSGRIKGTCSRMILLTELGKKSTVLWPGTYENYSKVVNFVEKAATIILFSVTVPLCSTIHPSD